MFNRRLKGLMAEVLGDVRGMERRLSQLEYGHSLALREDLTVAERLTQMEQELAALKDYFQVRTIPVAAAPASILVVEWEQ